MDLPLIPILGPFGRNQLVTALNARHPEFGTRIGQYRRYGKLPVSYRCDAKGCSNYCDPIRRVTFRFDLDQERISLISL